MPLSIRSFRRVSALALGLPCALSATGTLRPEADVRMGKAGWVSIQVQGAAEASVVVTLHDPAGRRLEAAEAGEVVAVLGSLHLFKPAGPPRALLLRATNRLEPGAYAELALPAPTLAPVLELKAPPAVPYPGGLEQILPRPQTGVGQAQGAADPFFQEAPVGHARHVFQGHPAHPCSTSPRVSPWMTRARSISPTPAMG
jgi:hypothetical protein